MVITRHLMDCMWTLSSADGERSAGPAGRGCERRQVKTSCVMSGRADGRDGSEESGRGSSRRENGRIRRSRWRSPAAAGARPTSVGRSSRTWFDGANGVVGVALIELGRKKRFPTRVDCASD